MRIIKRIGWIGLAIQHPSVVFLNRSIAQPIDPDNHGSFVQTPPARAALQEPNTDNHNLTVPLFRLEPHQLGMEPTAHASVARPGLIWLCDSGLGCWLRLGRETQPRDARCGMEWIRLLDFAEAFVDGNVSILVGRNRPAMVTDILLLVGLVSNAGPRVVSWATNLTISQLNLACSSKA